MQNPDPLPLPTGMFTSCPGCLKQFRIQASQLSTASGQVECGVCGLQFNALSRLSDTPLALDQISYEYDYEPGQKSPPENLLAGEPDFLIPATENEPETISETELNDDVLLDEFPNEILGQMPEELLVKPPAKRSLLATIVWSLGAFLLCLIIVLQLAWFNRDELLIRYPQLEPAAKEICLRLQCEIFRYKDIGAIKLLNRDVRNHPLFEDSLLVNATMANQSDTIQPYPHIQLALFNPAGEVIGYREFEPKEYLDDSIEIQAGMQAQSPIHIVLEVSGPTQDAVSFEFHFL